MAVCLSSCHVYKSYERPAVNVADSLFRTGISTADTTGIASLSWREMFRDPELQKLIERGLAGNADLNIAALRVSEAEARLTSSKLAFLPSLSITPQGTVNKSEGESSTRSFSIAASSQWEIDASGRLLSKKRGAAADVLQAEAYRQAVQTKLVAAIADSYYTLLMLDEQAGIARRTAESWRECVRVMKALMKAGEADQLAVSQSEASLYAVEASAVSIAQQINEVENSLSTLLGMPAQTIRRTTLGEQHFPDSMATGVPLQMLANRPDIRSSEMNLASAFYATETARAAFYPAVTLSGSAGWTNTATGRISNPADWLFSAIGGIVQPLFNRGTNMANLKVAEARQKEALISFQQSILDAGREVNDALVQWQSATKRMALDEQQTQALGNALRSAQLKMQHGSDNYLSVLTAQQSLLRARMDTAADKFDKIQGVISLYHALGGGL